MQHKLIYTLISKFFQKELSDKIQKDFRRWFVNGYFRKEKEEALEALWEERNEIADAKTYKELEAVHSRIDHLSPPVIKRSFVTYLFRAVAILLLPLIGAFSVYVYFENSLSTNEMEWVEHFTASGERKEITLPDGSNVWINSGSVLLYYKQFKGKKRTIYLNGEAIFDVVADPGRPFFVKTHYMDLEVLGTRFNVEAYPDAEYTIATLERGKIQIHMEGKKPVPMLPDQQIQLHNREGIIKMETVDAGKVLQWQHGYITFQKASFDYIVQTLQRRYDITINYESSRFTGRRFNLKIHPEESIEQALEILKEMMPDLKYKINGNVIYIN